MLKVFLLKMLSILQNLAPLRTWNHRCDQSAAFRIYVQFSVLCPLYLYPGVLAVHGDAEVVGGGEGVQPGQGEAGKAGEDDWSEAQC